MGSSQMRAPACASRDRKSTRLNSSHGSISYAVFCLKKKNLKTATHYAKGRRVEQLRLHSRAFSTGADAYFDHYAFHSLIHTHPRRRHPYMCPHATAP